MCHRGPCGGGGDASRFSGWGAGISPISRTRKAILCRMRRAAVRHLPISAPGAQEEAIWWFLVGIPVRLFGEMASGGKNKKRSLARWLNSVSAVRTRLELATPGVTGRYSKPTELPHQLSVNFPFGIAKVQLKFDSANILKDFNEKNVRPRGGGHFQRVCGRGRSLEREICRSLEREGCFTTTGRFAVASKGKVAGPRREGHRTL